MMKQILIVLGILWIFGCADVSKESQFQTGCSEGSESTPENEYVSPAPTPTPTVASWTKQLGTSSGDGGRGITSDPSGNIYVTGYTGGGLDGNTSAGGHDLFVVKYDTSGVKQWTKQLGTSGYDEGWGITSDSSGNLYATGYISFGLDGNTSAGGFDLFVVKYNSSGVKQWTKQLGTASDDFGTGITSDSSGNIYVTGYTEGHLDGNTSAGYNDLIVVKYNSSGVKQWTRQLGTSSNDYGFSITSDPSGNVYVTGSTEGKLDGNNSSGNQDIIVVKYNSIGIKQWTQQIGTSGEEFGEDIASDLSGHVYVTGITTGGLDGNTSAGGFDLIVVKYNSSGVKQWTRQLGTPSEDRGIGITSDSSGNIYVTGHTVGGLDGNTSAGYNDLIVVKYNSSGVKQWTRQLGTSSNDYGFSITSDSSDNVYITGLTRGDLDGNTSAGEFDLILVKYDSNGNKQ